MSAYDSKNIFYIAANKNKTPTVKDIILKANKNVPSCVKKAGKIKRDAPNPKNEIAVVPKAIFLQF